MHQRRWRALAWLSGALALAGVATAQAPAPPPVQPPAPAPAPGPAPAATAATPQADPQMRQVLDAYKALSPQPRHTLKPAQARQQPSVHDAVRQLLNQQGRPVTPEKVARVEDRNIPGPQGQLPLRVYTPDGTGPFPLIVYFHGGGFVIGDLDSHDASARALANQAKAVVVSVDYRLAPEHQYPAAVHDAAAAFRYLQKNAAQFGADPQRVAVAGEGAGANLASALTIRQKANGGKLPVFQLLLYPFVSNDLTTASHRELGKGDYLVGNDELAWYLRTYLGPGWQQVTDPEALPIHASPDQLRGLPPAMVITAGLDPLKDQGIELARRLQLAGVPVEVKTYEGVTHDFFGLSAALDKARQAQADAGAALRRVFEQSPAVGGAGQPR